MSWAKRALIVAAVLLLAWLVDWAGVAHINPYVAYLLRLIGINIILAVSLNLIMGYTGQFSLGHAGFMAMGAYGSAALSTSLVARFGGSVASPGLQVLLFVAVLLAGGLVAAVMGMIVGLPTLRLRGDYLAIATMGFGEIIRVMFVNLEALGGARGLTGIPALGEVSWKGMPVVSSFFWVALGALLTVWVIWRIVSCTRGRAFLCVREDEIAAESVGINTTYYKVLAFVLGAFFAGVAGALFAHDPSQRYINPDTFKFMKSIEVVVMVILGGMGSMTGSVVGAGVLTYLPEALRRIGEYRLVIYSVLLILLMLVRPQGLLGGKELSLRRLWRRQPRPQSVSEPPGPPPLPAAGLPDEILLELRECTKRFGGLVAVDRFSACLRPRELVGLIGPNGAGKTTVFNLITGNHTPTSGAILMQGERIGGLRPFQIAQRHVARTFQNIRLFQGLSVLDNVRAPFIHGAGYSFWQAVLASPAQAAREREMDERCLALLRLFQLDDRCDLKSRNLPYGDQRRLEIARALALQPRLLLLDEPAAGMNPTEKQSLMLVIKRLNQEWGLTILLIEHDMNVVMGICERLIVLDFGQIIAEGEPQQIRHDPRVIAAYLGEVGQQAGQGESEGG